MEDDGRSLIIRVVALIAHEFGESPTEPPSLDRRVAHVQIAMAFLSQACGDDDDKVRALVNEMLQAPSIFIPPGEQEQ